MVQKKQKLREKLKKKKSILNLNMYNIFVKFFLKSGKKSKIKQRANTMFILLSKKLNIPVNKILLKIIFSFYTYIEVRRVTARRRLNIIPFSVRSSRRYFLVLKKIRDILKKKKFSVSKNFYIEFLKILKRRLRSKELKNINMTQAFFNRSNTHFRWHF